MRYQRQIFDGVTVLEILESRIDARSAPTLRKAILDSGSSRIVLDLTAVDYIDSTGLGAIVGALKAFGGRSELVVCGLAKTVQTLFRMTRMDQVFRVFADVEQATRSEARSA